ncbi:hypothetical protein EV421DRAFT_1734784 [Armillaria borealis]|uniref:Uncharacterized protein n=1 Tax=Armillaria borealis TaxID=47425 RepID=A0AA39MTC6_9AGAR|nr:hypothetical protein EV421DRAFT_1734784 [Armillaria borealis]
MNNSVEVQVLDRLNGQFAVASHSGCIKVFKIMNNKLSKALLWSVAIQDIPRGLAFAGHLNDHLMIFTVYTGEVIHIEAATKQVVQKTRLLGANGSATLSPDQRTLAVHNLNTGQFDLYPQNPLSASPTTSLTVSTTAGGHLIKQCAFAEEQAHSLLWETVYNNWHTRMYWKKTEMKEIADHHDCQIKQAQEEEARKVREAQAAQKAQEDKLVSLSVAFNIAMFLMVLVVALCIWSATYFYRAVVLSIVS